MSKRAEKAIEAYYGNIPDDADKVKAARHFYEQAEKDMIERACDMLMNYVFEEVTPEMRDHFRKRLEEE